MLVVAGCKMIFSFQLRLRYLFVSIFIAGLALNAVGDAKAKENICYFSNPNEYQKCFNDKSSLERRPKYPLTNQENYFQSFLDIIWIKGTCANGPHACPGAIFTIVELNSLTDKKVKITIGDKKTGGWGIRNNTPFISKKEFFIKTEDFVSWEEQKASRDMYETYLLAYLDEYGNNKNIKLIKFSLTYMPNRRRRDFMDEFFTSITGLQNGESRSIGNMRSNKLKSAIKSYEIIKSVIKVPTSTKKECIEVNKDKYPDLVGKYIRISKTINPLRSKLNMVPSNKIKPICN